MTNEIKKQENTVERIPAGRTYVPHVDIFETDDNIVILADMPDVDENSVDITLEKNILLPIVHIFFLRSYGTAICLFPKHIDLIPWQIQRRFSHIRDPKK